MPVNNHCEVIAPLDRLVDSISSRFKARHVSRPTATQGLQPGPAQQTLLIGPEGGWNEAEIGWALDQGCQGAS